MLTEAELLKRAHEMRRNPTEPEKRLWRVLSNSQLAGLKFRRQHVVVEAQAIVDFFCPAIGLAVEVDGDTHDDPSRDALRDARLNRLGFRVLRFSNYDVMANIDGVAASIVEAARARVPRWPSALPHPNPSPEGEGLSMQRPSR